MAWIPKILRWIAVVSLFLICASSRAETNAASPWRATVPGLKPLPLVATNAVPAPPPAEKATADGDEFFSKFRDAVQLLNHNHAQDAGIVMDLLTRAMSTSPWLEIALLKHAQLIESTNDEVAEEGYQLLRHRIANAPYFQSNADRANIFGVALQGAVDAGITRLRIRRVRAALARYHSRYFEYPESLTKLTILGYTDMENIHNARNVLLRYIPQMPQMTPFISYKGYDLEPTVAEPFYASSPRLEGTSQISETPPRYTALIKLPGRAEPTRLDENQTVQGFFIASIAKGGAILSTPTRVIVIVTPE